MSDQREETGAQLGGRDPNSEPDRDLTPTFVAIAPCCDRLVFASVDNPERKKENAREVAKMIRAGMRIETWPVERVREAKWICDCKKKARAGVVTE